jgi:hypothetical protein
MNFFTKQIQVKVQVFTSSKVYHDWKMLHELTVLVRITTAPWHLTDQMPRMGVDIVVVLDARGEKTLVGVKLAMKIVIDKLDLNDRLSILTLDTYEQPLMVPTYMSEHGRQVARLKINELVKRNGSDVASALREGAQVRPHDHVTQQILHVDMRAFIFVSEKDNPIWCPGLINSFTHRFCYCLERRRATTA